MNPTAKEKLQGWLIQLAAFLGLLSIAAIAYYLLVLRPTGQWLGLYPVQWNLATWGWLLPGLTVPLLIFFIFLKLVPSMDSIYDPNVRLVADTFSLSFMIVYFLANGFVEELLFRGALQQWLGLLPTAIIFTLVHVSYYKKPLMLLEVFALGLFIGFLYQASRSLWLCTIAHAFYNWMLMWLIKTNRIDYKPADTSS